MTPLGIEPATFWLVENHTFITNKCLFNNTGGDIFQHISSNVYSFLV